MKKLLVIILNLGLFTACQRSLMLPENSARTSTSIIGGQEASIQDFPFLINIWQISPRDNFIDHLCGGSLVAKKWVLTAAHCVLEDVTNKTLGSVKTSELKLYINSDYRSGFGGRELTVKSILVHPDFSWPRHDMALIELNEVVLDVTPVQLNAIKDLGSTKEHLTATVAGWGFIDGAGKTTADQLHQVQVPLLPRQACNQDWFVQKRGWQLGDDTLCASSNQDLHSACPGDSGGPLIVFENAAYIQIGVVSWGNACRNTDLSHRSNVQGYSDVAEALGWLNKYIK